MRINHSGGAAARWQARDNHALYYICRARSIYIGDVKQCARWLVTARPPRRYQIAPPDNEALITSLLLFTNARLFISSFCSHRRDAMSALCIGYVFLSRARLLRLSLGSVRVVVSKQPRHSK